MRIYDKLFNYNELFILLTLFTGYTMIFLLPKRFSRSQTLLAVTLGIYLVLFFDNVLCVQPFDFYDINDSSNIEPWDYLSQLMFGPFAYFFFYGCSMLRQTRYAYFIYTTIWALIAILCEAIAWHTGVYNYRRHYQILYSLPVYLLVLSFSFIIYLFFYRKQTITLQQRSEEKHER